eukprot:Sspe_Gene.99312::Locus_72798_Transcript_1_1_Confidence_1.000_Length_701::g.99312::m.99312
MEYVTVVGVGSLMKEASARTSFPNLVHFRRGRVKGYERIFNIVSVTGIRKGTVNPESSEIAALASRKAEKSEEDMLVSLFEVPSNEMPAFYEREQRYIIEKVPCVDDTGKECEALMCLQNTDEQYFAENCKGDKDLFHERVGQYFTGRIWRYPGDPIVFPIPAYLALCREGAAELGEDCHVNFLRTTFLLDGRSLQQYLKDRPDVDKATRPITESPTSA